MPTPHARTEILLGKELTQTLQNKHILIAGLGGVGGYTVENLARFGIGKLTLIDNDTVATSNLNRQLVALHSTIGKEKTDIMATRIADINPDCSVVTHKTFITTDNAADFFINNQYDFVADCIDTIACKAQFVLSAQQKNLPVISALGAGNRIDASRVKVTKLKKTTVCPLAREMRRKIKELKGSLDYPVVYSDEPRYSVPLANRDEHTNFIAKSTNGTISYLPAIIGVLIAGEIIKQLIITESNK